MTTTRISLLLTPVSNINPNNLRVIDRRINRILDKDTEEVIDVKIIETDEIKKIKIKDISMFYYYLVIDGIDFKIINTNHC